MSVYKCHAFIFLDQPPPWPSRTLAFFSFKVLEKCRRKFSLWHSTGAVLMQISLDYPEYSGTSSRGYFVFSGEFWEVQYFKTLLTVCSQLCGNSGKTVDPNAIFRLLPKHSGHFCHSVSENQLKHFQECCSINTQRGNHHLRRTSKNY
jgi:hypothetical protein